VINSEFITNHCKGTVKLSFKRIIHTGQLHVRLIKMNSMEVSPMHPQGQQAWQCKSVHHKTLCRRFKTKKVALHTILPSVGVSIIPHTSHHLKELGLDSRRVHKSALKLHAHSEQNYTHT